MANSTSVVLLSVSKRNANYRTIFSRKGVWGVTRGNKALRHIVPGAMVCFFKSKDVLALAVVDETLDEPPLQHCDRLWTRIKWHAGQETRTGQPCAKMFWLRVVATPNWTKEDVKGWLGLKERDNIQNGRRVDNAHFAAMVRAELEAAAATHPGPA